MASAFKIESDIPLPENAGKRGRPAIYPWARMTVGDSFAVPLTHAKRVHAAANKRREHYGDHFTIRMMPEEGVARVWRLK